MNLLYYKFHIILKYMLEVKMHKTKIKDFEPNFLKKIKRLINDDNLERAESSLKKALKINSVKPKFKSKMYSMLGEIHYIKGNYISSKRYYVKSLQFNPGNEYTLFNIANYYLYEQQWEKALPYIEKNLKSAPGNPKYLIQYIWCLILKEEYELALIIYKKLLASNKIDPQGFVDISMAFIIKGDFEKARKIIFTALGKFPENYIIEDTMMEIDDIEYNYKLFRKDIFFKRLNELCNGNHIYTKALKKLVEGMSIRGYFQFEIEKGADLLISLSKLDNIFTDSNTLAAVCELIISMSVGHYPQLYENLSGFYNTSVYKIKKRYKYLKENHEDLLNTFSSEVLYLYEEEFDKSHNFDGETDE